MFSAEFCLFVDWSSSLSILDRELDEDMSGDEPLLPVPNDLRPFVNFENENLFTLDGVWISSWFESKLSLTGVALFIIVSVHLFSLFAEQYTKLNS